MLRKVAVGVAGFAVLALGLALLVAPVPGTTFVLVPLGVGLLAKEFAWARRLVAWSKDLVRRLWPGRGPSVANA